MTSGKQPLRNHLGQALGQVPLLIRGFALMWRVAPNLSAGYLAVISIQGLLPAAIVHLTRTLIDSLVASTGHGGSWNLAQGPILYALIMASLLIASELLAGLSSWIRVAHAERLRDFLSDLVHTKAISVDYEYYDSSDYFDELYRICQDVNTRPAALFENLGAILRSSITLLAMLGVLLRFGLWTPLALLASTIPALFVVMHFALREYQLRQRSAIDERRASYNAWLLTSPDAAAEIRVFGLGPHFATLYQQIRARLRNNRLALARDENIAGLIGATFGLAVTGAAIIWMVKLSMLGSVSLGELAMFYQAFNQGQGLMRNLLGTLGGLYTNSLFLHGLFTFLGLSPKQKQPEKGHPIPAKLASEIRFSNVGFRYPESKQFALRGCDLVIPAGSVAAVVGPNGAGKSTLIKLLCRLYDPSEGQITLDGIDLRQLWVDELHRHIAVLLQQPIRYCATFADNVAFGNLARLGDYNAVDQAIRAAGAHEIAEELPNGVANFLGKWFGGAELSAGQWQRVALARAFFRDAQIILLDEPTTAMDSWAEHEFMQHFRQLISGRTALIITHRFTTAMRADIIHVMAGGRIVESGSHQDLLALGGQYARSWQAQMQETKEA